MKRTTCRKTISGFLAFFLVSLGLMLKAGAQNTPWPKAEALFDSFTEKTGGQAAYHKIQNRRTISTMQLSVPPIAGEVTTYSTKSGPYHVSADLRAMGKAEYGSDGRTVWEINPVLGPQIKEGAERSRFLCLYGLDIPARWRLVFKKVECTGLETVEGKPAFKVVAVSLDDYPLTYYFDQASGLIVKIEYPQETLAGQGSQEVLLGDYRLADGILFPHFQKRLEQGREMTLIFKSIEHNVTLPENMFTLPEAIIKIAGLGK